MAHHPEDLVDLAPPPEGDEEQDAVDRYLPPFSPQQVLDSDDPVTSGTVGDGQMVTPQAHLSEAGVAHDLGQVRGLDERAHQAGEAGAATRERLPLARLVPRA